MKILNLGCGTKVSAHPDVTNIDWSMYLRLRRSRPGRTVAPVLLDDERLRRLNALPDNIEVHNLAKGLSFSSNSVDVVYHSHLLEHLDREIARTFLSEVLRVLKPGGIQRIVVPDMEKVCRAYVSHISACESDADEAAGHDRYISRIIEQSVRKEAVGTRSQRGIRRLIENVILGDARRRGETHQWMYDRINLSALLAGLGYGNVIIQRHNTSLIPNWNDYGLDMDEYGSEYKPDSLYIEAQK